MRKKYSFQIKLNTLAKYLALVLLPAMLLCGCSREYATLDEALEKNSRFGENIYIDGINVSGMSIEEARSAIEDAQARRLEAFQFTIRVGEETLSLSASALPVTFNTEEVMLEALKLYPYSPGKNAPRTFDTTMRANAESLRSTLSTLTKHFNQDAENAQAIYKGGAFTYTEEKDGQRIDVTTLANDVLAAIEGRGSTSIDANVQVLKPAYTLEEARADTELISKFSTSFAGSTYGNKNRVFNISKAAKILDGTVVPPGEALSMNRTLGDRNKENGWKEATGIRDKKYVQEYGGGVCQVSSTLYNAVLMADLEIVERWHHSWPLGYIDIGRDATISTGGPDFVFRNTSEYPVYIGAIADEKKKTITVMIFGHKSDEWESIKLSSKKVKSIQSPKKKVLLDASLPPQTRVVEIEERPGIISETYKTYYDENGDAIKKVLVSRDYYKEIQGVEYVSADIYYGRNASNTAS